MDAYNLAICFGPTLMPAPEEKDQVQCQNQVNDLIKNMIVYHDDLFQKDLGGTIYEKFISQEPFDCDVGDSPTEQVTEDPDSEVYPSEDGEFFFKNTFLPILYSYNPSHFHYLCIFLIKYFFFSQNPTQWKQQLNSILVHALNGNYHYEKVLF